ncbi:hypothetical protein [Sphingobacterium multivorum]|uniref:hypothetical protein n=1 Tax=Sphingobacterium multivorum TaxID=28454 RepID=UPI003DA4700C
MKQPISLLKQFFGAFKIPTGSNFSDLIDSFFHKDGKIPASNVEGWTDDSAVELPAGQLELPDLNTIKNKYIEVMGGVNGRTYTYKGKDYPISPNNKAIMFWSGADQTYRKQDENPIGVELDKNGGALSYNTGGAILEDCIVSQEGFSGLDISGGILQGGHDNGVPNNRLDRIRYNTKIDGNRIKIKVNSAYGMLVTWMSGNSFVAVTSWLEYTSLTEISNPNADSFKLHFRKDNEANILPSEFSNLGFELQVYKEAKLDKAVPQGWKNKNGGVLGYEYKDNILSVENKAIGYDDILENLFDSKPSGYYSFDFSGKIVQGGVATNGGLDTTTLNRIRINDLLAGSKFKIKISSPAQFWLTWYNSSKEKIGQEANWLQPTVMTEYTNVNASFFAVHFRKSTNNENISPADFPSFGVQMETWYNQKNRKAASQIELSETYKYVDKGRLINNYKIQISDGFLNAASASHLQINKKGIAFVSYLGGVGLNFGESPGRIMLSIFPVTQPSQSKHYLIKEGEMAFESNCMMISDDILRVNYFLNGYDFVNLKQNKFKDFNLSTKEISVEQQSKITYNNVAYDLNNESISNILLLNGINANFNWGVIDVCRPILRNGYNYKALCSVSMPNYQPQPIVFVRSNDGFATMEYVGCLNVGCMYECQMEYDTIAGKWHILYRTSTGISYVNTSDFINFSISQTVDNSITSRPCILKYKNKIIIVTNKGTTVTGLVGGVLPVNSRSRIVGQILNSTNINLSEIVFDISSRYGIVYPSIVDRNGELHMVFSDGSAQIEFSNNTGNQGKDSIFYYKIGEIQGEIGGEFLITK